MSGQDTLRRRRWFRRWVGLKRTAAPSRGRCTLAVDGRKIDALAGQTVAAALVNERLWLFRANQVSGDPRGPYCGMGVCFECEIEVDGITAVRACLTEVRDGMVIRTDAHRGVGMAHEP